MELTKEEAKLLRKIIRKKMKENGIYFEILENTQYLEVKINFSFGNNTSKGVKAKDILSKKLKEGYQI